MLSLGPGTEAVQTALCLLYVLYKALQALSMEQLVAGFNSGKSDKSALTLSLCL